MPWPAVMGVLPCHSFHSCLSTLVLALLRRTLWSRGVTVSTLDSESSDRGSNPRETCVSLIAAGYLGLETAKPLWE